MEQQILNGIQDIFQSPFMDSFMLFVTRLGDGGILWITIGILLLFIKKYRPYGMILLAGLLLGLIVGNGILKNLIARDRPSWIYDVALLIDNPTDFSFPSGHTQSSFIAATILTLTNRKWGYAAIPLAVLIAFSRLYLYVHFPSDVLFGALLGIGLGMIAFFGGEKIRKQWRQKR